MPTIDANGLTVGYDVAGAGPPLILLHGATSDAARDFRGQLPTLTEAFRCYTPDARGHGRTRWDTATGGFSADWLADDLLAFADALGLETFHRARVLAWGDDRAARRRPGARPIEDPRRRRHHDRPRTARQRRPTADGPDPDRP